MTKTITSDLFVDCYETNAPTQGAELEPQATLSPVPQYVARYRPNESVGKIFTCDKFVYKIRYNKP